MVCECGGHLAEPLHGGLLSRLIVLVAFMSRNGAACERVAPERCLVWGPGLSSDMVVPVRYFFIQAADSNGEKLTVSPGNEPTSRTDSLQKRRGAKQSSGAEVSRFWC